MTAALTTALIDQAALQHNLSHVRQLVPGHQVMAVVKANAYGHDLQISLPAFSNADALAVARVVEGAALRIDGYSGRVVVLEGALSPEDLALAEQHDLELVIHHYSQLELLEQHHGSLFDVWLKVDTGMNRLGFPVTEFADVHRRIMSCGAVRAPARLMTHLARADEPDHPMTGIQIEKFEQAVNALPGECSVANSAGVLAFAKRCRGWVRPGLMLYGISPFADQCGEEIGLRPVMQLRTRLIAIRKVRCGDTVGYGGTWTASSDTAIGTAALGYGDGYPGNMPSGTPVLVGGERRSLAGRVSMDMITIDLGDGDYQVGEEVVVWGPGLPVEQIAAACGRLPYELVCGVSQRVPRVRS